MRSAAARSVHFKAAGLMAPLFFGSSVAGEKQFD